MSDPKQAAVLLSAAERDLEAARKMLDPGFHDVVFRADRPVSGSVNFSPEPALPHGIR